MRKTKKRMILCCILLIAVLAFIWGNSLRTGEESGAMSGGILQWINAFLHLDEAGAEKLHFAIRKMAHFTEFACFGTLLCWFFGMTGEKSAHLICMPLLFGLLTACVDETIQVFSPGRHCSIVDVGIDSGGVVTGLLVLVLGHLLFRSNIRVFRRDT